GGSAVIIIQLIMVYKGVASRIIENTPDSFFMNINKLLRDASYMLYKKLKEIPHVDCSHKPEVKLNVSDFNDIVDDTDFSMKLAKEESVIVSQVMNRSTIRQRVYKYLKRKADGLKTWIRVSYSTEPKRLEESIQRM
ncbi:tyrosine/nicotianamine aminotransferase, pyridoxal phosphate-dependent transferase, partial [Tanacetum coccineum]